MLFSSRPFFYGTITGVLFTVLQSQPAVAKTLVYVSLEAENKISLFEFDEATAQLKHQADFALNADPGGFIADRKKENMYVAFRAAGKLGSFKIDRESGALTPKNEVPADIDPAYLEFDQTGRFLLSAYYVAAKVAVHPLRDDGEIDPDGKWYPTAKNAHAIVTDRSNQWLFVPHTGPNAIYQFHFDAQTGSLRSNSNPFWQSSPNTGPRHFDFHPKLDIAYCNNEQGSSITVFDIDSQSGHIQSKQTISTLPTGFKKPNSCARMQIHPNGRFLYSANRGHDSIAGFSIDQKTGTTTSIGQFATEKTPRSFHIHPNGKFMIVAGEGADRLAVYRIESDGQLTRLSSQSTGKKPWWLLIVTLD